MSKILPLIGTGITLGIVHVLTGPDHLSALATLSANVHVKDAFLLGIRWGIGHSTGLLLVGIIFILISRNNNDEEETVVEVPEVVSSFFESLVGIFMLVLGAYGIRRAWEKRPKIYGNIPENSSQQPNFELLGDENNIENANDEQGEESMIDPTNPEHSYHNHFNIQHFVTTDNNNNSSVIEQGRTTTEIGQLWNKFTQNVSTRTMALCAGIFHGLSGPGGVLGVIPAVQLHNGRLAAIYLGCFCISSTLTMGLFATLYGTCSTRIIQNNNDNNNNIESNSNAGGNYKEFVIECLSASLSLIVGILWLVLLSIGKLDDVFP